MKKANWVQDVSGLVFQAKEGRKPLYNSHRRFCTAPFVCLKVLEYLFGINTPRKGRTF